MLSELERVDISKEPAVLNPHSLARERTPFYMTVCKNDHKQIRTDDITSEN